MSIKDRDDLEGGFYRTERFYGLVCDVGENDATPKYRARPIYLRSY
jgi:hypothetical protein